MENRYASQSKQHRAKWWLYALLVFLVIQILLAMYYDQEPDLFDVKVNTEKYAKEYHWRDVTGVASGAAFLEITEVLLNKSGGYMSNDVMPPFVLMDNMPKWEFGVVIQVRDFVRVVRNDISRSQSQSEEDADLADSDPKFHNDHDKWMWPATEGKFESGREYFLKYMNRLAGSEQPPAEFYARTDNLVTWLNLVEKRLGSLSKRLSASVGEERINTNSGGDSTAESATYQPSELRVKTPWLEIDDNFYEARGSTWALIHLLKATEVDFKAVLEKKNALVSLRQIIRELEATQDSVWTPMILNGSGFGFFANHSLVMASYISRANAGVIDLRQLLEDG